MKEIERIFLLTLTKRVVLFSSIAVIALLLIAYSPFTAKNEFKLTSNGKSISSGDTEQLTIEDIDQTKTAYAISDSGNHQATITITTREFPNGDAVVYIEGASDGYLEPIHVELPATGEPALDYTEDKTVPELYPHRKERKLDDPLSTTLRYIENETNSVLVGTSAYFNDISHSYEDGQVSRVIELQREAESLKTGEEAWEITVQFEPGEENFSTWLMISNEALVNGEAEFQQVHKIATDEFRWVTPNTLWSHGLNAIFPRTDRAFVRSLVRQSGRASAVMLETAPSRIWENINRAQFASLETARNEDGLWHSDYTSTWLERSYGIGPDYIDTRHNDNLFRAQLKRAEQLGYDAYAQERSVYADFLIEMTEAGYTIPQGPGYYLMDYFDMEHDTHSSLNHALSLMNYQYDAYLHLGDAKYLESAEDQFAALLHTGTGWVNDENTIIYQMRPDGTMSGKDYNLVTYYDLLYTKKLRNDLGLASSETLDHLIKVKEQNLHDKGMAIEGTLENVEEFVGLIE